MCRPSVLYHCNNKLYYHLIDIPGLCILISVIILLLLYYVKKKLMRQGPYMEGPLTRPANSTLPGVVLL